MCFQREPEAHRQPVQISAADFKTVTDRDKIGRHILSISINFIIETDIREYPMDTDVLSTSVAMVQTGRPPQRIARPAGFMPGCLFPNDSLRCTCSFLKRTRFTPLIINNRVLSLNYIGKIRRPLQDFLLPGSM